MAPQGLRTGGESLELLLRGRLQDLRRQRGGLHHWLLQLRGALGAVHLLAGAQHGNCDAQRGTAPQKEGVEAVEVEQLPVMRWTTIPIQWNPLIFAS